MNKFASLIVIFLISLTAVGQGWSELGTGIHALNADLAIDALVSDSSGILYAGGAFRNSMGQRYVAKWDGANWSELGAGEDSLVTNGEVVTMCKDKWGDLYAAGSLSDSLDGIYVAKWDGAHWAKVGTGAHALHANGIIFAITCDTLGNLYAAGEFSDTTTMLYGHPYLAKWDGTSWTQVGLGASALNANASIRSILAYNDSFVYVAGDFTSHVTGYHYVAKWDGTQWSELGTGSNAIMANASIWTICADKLGNLFAGGFFENGSGHCYVAKWDGVLWRELGTGANALNANAAIVHICSDPLNRIYAVGVFTDSSFINFVAYWEEGSWNRLLDAAHSNYFNGEIYYVTTSNDGNVYVCGDFSDGTTTMSGYMFVAQYSGLYNGIQLAYNCLNDMRIYPNPSNGKLIVSCSEQMIGESYSVTDFSGRVVTTGVCHTRKFEVDISKTLSGAYLFHLKNIFITIIKQ